MGILYVVFFSKNVKKWPFSILCFFVENELQKIVSLYSGEKRMFSTQEKLSF